MDPVQKAVINHTFGVSIPPKKKQVISCNVCQLRFNSDVSTGYFLFLLLFKIGLINPSFFSPSWQLLFCIHSAQTSGLIFGPLRDRSLALTVAIHLCPCTWGAGCTFSQLLDANFLNISTIYWNATPAACLCFQIQIAMIAHVTSTGGGLSYSPVKFKREQTKKLCSLHVIPTFFFFKRYLFPVVFMFFLIMPLDFFLIKSAFQ